LHIVTDSTFVMDGLTENLPEWEDRGWTGVAHRELFRYAVGKLRGRSARTTFRWTKGHAGDEGNEGADALAKLGATKPDNLRCVSITSDVAKFLPRGVRLGSLTQSLAYEAIRERKKRTPRRTTELTVERVLTTLEVDWKCAVPPQKLWKAIRHKDLHRKHQVFLWKALHDAYKVGSYWDNIRGYEQRGTCAHCDVPETMEHILIDCSAPGCKQIWRLTIELLRKAGIRISDVAFGTVLGAAAVNLGKDTVRKPSTAINRLFKLTIIESAHLIWALRCERVIRFEDEPERQRNEAYVMRIWLSVMTKRLTMDWVLTRVQTRARTRLTADAVGSTWDLCGGLDGIRALWSAHTGGVLVGSRRPAIGIG
ncbi:hypothetical protein C8Q76DRAFT_604965, partial [Earliella scabrosa]